MHLLAQPSRRAGPRIVEALLVRPAQDLRELGRTLLAAAAAAEHRAVGRRCLAAPVIPPTGLASAPHRKSLQKHYERRNGVRQPQH